MSNIYTLFYYSYHRQAEKVKGGLLVFIMQLFSWQVAIGNAVTGSALKSMRGELSFDLCALDIVPLCKQ